MGRSSRENPTTTSNINIIHLQALAIATPYARVQLTKEKEIPLQSSNSRTASTEHVEEGIGVDYD